VRGAAAHDGKLEQVLATQLAHSARFDVHDARFDQIDRRFDQIDGRLAEVLARLPQRPE
jgi:hypothetical protein